MCQWDLLTHAKDVTIEMTPFASLSPFSLRLFNLFWSFGKHDANPINASTIR